MAGSLGPAAAHPGPRSALAAPCSLLRAEGAAEATAPGAPRRCRQAQGWASCGPACVRKAPPPRARSEIIIHWL